MLTLIFKVHISYCKFFKINVFFVLVVKMLQLKLEQSEIIESDLKRSLEHETSKSRDFVDTHYRTCANMTSQIDKLHLQRQQAEESNIMKIEKLM